MVPCVNEELQMFLCSVPDDHVVSLLLIKIHFVAFCYNKSMFHFARLCSRLQTTSSRRWASNRVRPPPRGRAPPPGSTDPDWASTRPARPSTCPSWAPLCRAPCRAAPPCWPHVRDRTPWTSLKCAPAWSPRWLAETQSHVSLAVTPRGIQAHYWSEVSAFRVMSSSCLLLSLVQLFLALEGWRDSPQVKGRSTGELFVS